MFLEFLYIFITMKEVITNKLSIKNMILINKLQRAETLELMIKMKEYYLQEEYYMTASKLHCLIVDPKFDIIYANQLIIRLWNPELDNLLEIF